MLLLMKILVLIAVGYLLIYLFVPGGNMLYEGVRLPFWLLRVRRMATVGDEPRKIRYGSHFRQYLLHFAPMQGAPEKQHVVIYIHGSGWQFGRPEMFKANAQWLTGQGHHTFFLSHRRIPLCDIRQLREDTRMGIKTVLDEMQQLGLSEKKILLCGNSAGGNLVALAMLDRSLLAQSGVSSDRFSALAVFAAPLDLSVMWPSPPLLMVTRMKRQEVYCLADPIRYLETALNMPILLIHGDKDGIVEHENSVVFYEKLRALGSKDVQFETIENGMHLDAASWCFPGHPSCEIFRKWLERIESQ
jgi:acetyl esterase/lipase